jgi:hypothetical protein
LAGYLPRELTSGKGTNMEAMIHPIRARKTMVSVAEISRRKNFFIKDVLKVNVFNFSNRQGSGMTV